MTATAAKKAYKALQVRYAKQVPGMVRKGVRFLDAELPDWVENIDIACLNLQDSEMCMLGQAHHAQFSGGMDLLHSVTGDALLTGGPYGFDLPDYVGEALYKLEDLLQRDLSDHPFWSMLQEEWNAVLVKRVCKLTSEKAKARLEELFD